MAEDKVETREATWRQLLPWTELFRGFQIAIDLNKIALAAAGILVMAAGWWVLALIFSNLAGSTEYNWPASYQAAAEGGVDTAWAEFKRDRGYWNLLHEATGVGGSDKVWDVGDLAQSPEEFDRVDAATKGLTFPNRASVAAALAGAQLDERRFELFRKYLFAPKPSGTLATWPWFENRGPNPYLLVTGQAGIPWEPGRFWEWFARDQAPVMLEPLIKLFRPVVYFFSPRATGWLRFYFLLVVLWTLFTWSLFGGAITRIAAVQIARGDKIGMSEALRFTWKRLLHYVTAPLFPLGIGVVLPMLLLWLFGVLQWIPFVGDLTTGVLWLFLVVPALGLVMAIALVGLVSWPLMPATISAQGTDNWEAVSRSYSYLYQRPWQFVWYALVAVVYGGILVLVIGFFGSFAVYLGKWGMAQTPAIQYFKRDPTYLFVYAPTSFGWRTLLLEGLKAPDGRNVVEHGEIIEDRYKAFLNDSELMRGWNKFGAVLAAIGIGVLFLLILGFGYSYFWSASTILYFLLRKQVDAEEMDEVHLEEEEEGLYGGPALAPAPVTGAAPRPASGTPLTMVEAPALRPVPGPAEPVSPGVEPGAGAGPVSAPAPLPREGDGNPPEPMK